MPIAGTTLKAKETTVNGDDVTEAVYYALTLEETDGGFHIKDVNGQYIYNTMMTPHKLSSSTSAPMDSWTITIAEDENSTATISCNGYVIVYNEGEFVAVDANAVPATAVYPTLYGIHETGIDKVIGENREENAIYDLQGRKVEHITNGGIYIVNGKKILVK
jgi:hypothetical protein